MIFASFFFNEKVKIFIVGKYAEILFKEYYPELEEIVYTTDPREAFADIDFELMQIRAGRLRMREKDEKISIKHGCLGQETCGAGGFAYGMRSIPAVIDIIKLIRRYSPECWILNYSNPATIVAEATQRVFADDYRIINIFDKKTGEDYLPKLREILKKPVDVQTEPLFQEPSWKATFHFMSQMINDYDEYLPNTYLQYYLYPNKMFKKQNPDYTRANEVMDGNEKATYERLEKIISLGKIHETEFELTRDVGCHAEYIVDLATALANNTREIFLIITENKGTIENLDSKMMVEVPCRVGSNGIETLTVGSLSTFYKGLMENQYAYEKLTVDACLEGSYKKALQALVLNRTVVNTDVAKELLADLMEANKEYWNELK